MKKNNSYKGKFALVGNPNVGKSTIFNCLTGMHQHTGNWPGKTVGSAEGVTKYKDNEYLIYDLPGTYSLIAHSQEEEVTRDFICFEDYDGVIVVCDAVCLERNLNLVIQILEITSNVVVCVNLLDEAKKKKIKIDLKKLSTELGVPVVGTSARSGKGIKDLLEMAVKAVEKPKKNTLIVDYPQEIENSIKKIEKTLEITNLSSRWLALKLLNYDSFFIESLNKYFGYNFFDKKLKKVVIDARKDLNNKKLNPSNLEDIMVTSIVKKAEEISDNVITFENVNYNKKDRKVDKILTSKKYGFPIMLCLLMVVFWITIIGANYPSSILYDFLFWIEDKLLDLFRMIKAPIWLSNCLVLGVYRVLAWVISVMLPPMAIFFPLFTLLEDLGYLPRIAFNLDRCFKKCKTCGKQALTMCMGFGCNAAGVTGARIIDSPRERLIAILTNSFVPCNGRFPAIISIITMFFVGFNVSLGNSLLTTLILTLVILMGIFMTFTISRLLSNTILKGMPSSFTLELPPYRKPQIGKVLIRSIFDRTLFVLGRAISVAAPAGLVIWVLANVNYNGLSLLEYCSNFLDPIGSLMGLDGVILMAFILGFPANEIVIPLIIMGYMAMGTITEFDNLVELKKLLISNGWTTTTAINFIVFSLFHFPCSTTCMTIRKETGSNKWMFVAIIIPTLVGFIFCVLINLFFKII